MKNEKRINCFRITIILLFIVATISIYSCTSHGFTSGGGPSNNDTLAPVQVADFRSRQTAIFKLFHVYGLYYTVNGLRKYLDTLKKSDIDSIVNTGVLTAKNDTTVIYNGNDTAVNSYGLDTLLKKNDTLEIVMAFYWKKKYDTLNGKKEMSFTIVPTLQIPNSNPRKGIVDYFDSTGDLYRFYNHKNDTTKFGNIRFSLRTPFTGGGGTNSSDNGTMFP